MIVSEDVAVKQQTAGKQIDRMFMVIEQFLNGVDKCRVLDSRVA
jgi:hypothetical protein